MILYTLGTRVKAQAPPPMRTKEQRGVHALETKHLPETQLKMNRACPVLGPCLSSLKPGGEYEGHPLLPCPETLLCELTDSRVFCILV